MLLAIDTCGSLGGVALGPAEDSIVPTSQNRDVGHPFSVEGLHKPSSENRNLSTGSGRALGLTGWFFRELAGKTFSESLIATIAEMLDEAAATLAQLTGIVVVHGPGSFTGIRIGVSAAKGFALALEIPLIAVSRLELLARQASADSAIAVLDAGRGEFYAGVYRGTGRGDGVREAELLLSRKQLAGLAADSELPILACEERVFSALKGQRVELVAAPTAIDALNVGTERFRLGAFDDVATLDANYLRRSETEMLARIAEHAAIRAAEASGRQ